MEPDYVKLKEIKPALSGYIRKSKILLNKSVVPDDKAVHDIRVLMKKSRALLKLTATQPDLTYHERDIAELREVGRILSSWRETSVQRKTLKDLRKEFPEIFDQLHENTMLTMVLDKTESLKEPGVEMKADVEQINFLLDKTGYRIRFQSMNMIDPQRLIKELEVTYKRVADIYLLCRNNPKPETLHKFRKKAKDFLYQLYIFRTLNPPVVKILEKKLNSMTLNLGKFYDLAQIIKALEYNYKDTTNLPAMNELIIVFREKQEKYLTKVWPQAYQIFCPGKKLVNVLGFKLLVI